MSEEWRRLREKLAQWGGRELTGSDLARLMDEVSSDMREANPGPEPYDLSAGPGRLGHPRSRLG
jgi:hypothetical protein